MQTDEETIREFVGEWLRASEAGDADKVLSLIAEDVVFLTAGQHPMRGKDAFAACQSSMRGVKIQADSKIQEIKILGDFAYLWTELTVAVTRAGGNPVKRAGYTLSILKKESGRWLIYRDANMLAEA